MCPDNEEVAAKRKIKDTNFSPLKEMNIFSLAANEVMYVIITITPPKNIKISK
jgi:hypothetical protein